MGCCCSNDVVPDVPKEIKPDPEKTGDVDVVGSCMKPCEAV
jgi:hypothetical protein